MSIITAKILRGFRDGLPADERLRLALISELQRCFTGHGFDPIDTPVLEYSELLLGDSGQETEKQVYRFCDQGGRDVAMRFDLTVPLARFVAQHRQQLPLPFKRYQIAKVWRGENTQRGRYREFYQCDFDIVGSSHRSADLEVLVTAQHCLTQLGGQCRLAINHRGLLNLLFDKLGINGALHYEVMRLLDKKAKLDQDDFRQQLRHLLGQQRSTEMAQLLAPATDLDDVQHLSGPCEAIEHLRQLLEHAEFLGLNLYYDPTIMRGLAYYTGLVFESFLEQLPELGSVCSGGRYDNLVGRYSHQPLTGVGGSVGLDRLLYGLQQLQILTAQAQGVQLFIPLTDEGDYHLYHRLAQQLRPQFSCEVYAGDERKLRSLGQQLQYAADRGAQLALIHSDEQLKVRRLADRYDFEPQVFPRQPQQLAPLCTALTQILQEK